MGGICPNLPKWCSPFFTHMVHGCSCLGHFFLSAHSLLLYLKKTIKPSSHPATAVRAYLCCIPRSQAQDRHEILRLVLLQTLRRGRQIWGFWMWFGLLPWKPTWLLQPLQIPWPALGFSMVLTKSLRWTQGSQRLSTIVQPSWSAGPSKTWWSDATRPLFSGPLAEALLSKALRSSCTIRKGPTKTCYNIVICSLTPNPKTSLKWFHGR